MNSHALRERLHLLLSLAWCLCQLEVSWTNYNGQGELSITEPQRFGKFGGEDFPFSGNGLPIPHQDGHRQLSSLSPSTQQVLVLMHPYSKSAALAGHAALALSCPLFHDHQKEKIQGKRVGRHPQSKNSSSLYVAHRILI